MPKAGASSPSISVSVAFPPAPCAIVICSSRNLAGFAAHALDQVEGVLLAILERAHQTVARSRARRPKL